MQILNCNIEHPDLERVKKVFKELRTHNPEILIITSANEVVRHPSGKTLLGHIDDLPLVLNGILSTVGKGETLIYTHYDPNIVEHTQGRIISEYQTPLGPLWIYAVTLPPVKGKAIAFKNSLAKLEKDFEKHLKDKHVCLVGNFQISFKGNEHGELQKLMNTFFQKHDLVNLSAYENNCMDHIAISNSFIKGKFADIDTLNRNKKFGQRCWTVITIEE
jgi:hypothetical protein